jgi:hypothetical protein
MGDSKWIKMAQDEAKNPLYGNNFKPSSSINHNISLTAEYGETCQHRPSSTAVLNYLWISIWKKALSDMTSLIFRYSTKPTMRRWLRTLNCGRKGMGCNLFQVIIPAICLGGIQPGKSLPVTAKLTVNAAVIWNVTLVHVNSVSLNPVWIPEIFTSEHILF